MINLKLIFGVSLSYFYNNKSLIFDEQQKYLMNNKSALDPEYGKFVSSNPNKKFILYLRRHPLDEKEKILLNELSNTYGEYKEIPKDRLAIFIITGNNVQEFIDILNKSETEMYLSFIQDENELTNT